MVDESAKVADSSFVLLFFCRSVQGVGTKERREGYPVIHEPVIKEG